MQYVHEGEIKYAPQKYKFKNGCTTGNFAEMDVATHIAEGWIPITTWLNAVYDADTQIQSEPEITLHGNHAKVTYTLRDIPLETLREKMRNKIKAEGRNVIYDKYDMESRERIFAGVDSNTQYGIDLAAIQAHWQVIKQAIDDASTAEEILQITTTPIGWGDVEVIPPSGGTGLEWPTI